MKNQSSQPNPEQLKLSPLALFLTEDQRKATLAYIDLKNAIEKHAPEMTLGTVADALEQISCERKWDLEQMLRSICEGTRAHRAQREKRRLEELPQFVAYLWDFYGPDGGIYADFFDPPLAREEVEAAAEEQSRHPNFSGDSDDRELARDIMLVKRGLKPQGLWPTAEEVEALEKR